MPLPIVLFLIALVGIIAYLVRDQFKATAEGPRETPLSKAEAQDEKLDYRLRRRFGK